MSRNNYYLIKSTVELQFNNSELCEISHNSFLPEFDKLQTRRSKVSMEKTEDILTFHIESTDITAFRASINEIIGLGKIIEGILEICRGNDEFEEWSRYKNGSKRSN